MFKNLFSTLFKAGSTASAYLRAAKIIMVVLGVLFIGGTVYGGVSYVKGLQAKNLALTLKVAEQEKEIGELKQTAAQNQATGQVNTATVAEVKDNHAAAEEDQKTVVITRDEKIAVVKKKYAHVPVVEKEAVKTPEQQARLERAREISAIQVDAMWSAYCKIAGTTVAEDCQKDTQDNLPVQKAKIVTGADVPNYLSMGTEERAQALSDLYESTLHYIVDEAHA